MIANVLSINEILDSVKRAENAILRAKQWFAKTNHTDEAKSIQSILNLLYSRAPEFQWWVAIDHQEDSLVLSIEPTLHITPGTRPCCFHIDGVRDIDADFAEVVNDNFWDLI